jgi:hypothetical protein
LGVGEPVEAYPNGLYLRASDLDLEENVKRLENEIRDKIIFTYIFEFHALLGLCCRNKTGALAPERTPLGTVQKKRNGWATSKLEQ